MKRDYPDFAGYLNIEGTKIEYPVMYSPDEPEKYLHKDINGKECTEGLPFIDARCSVSPDSDNLIIFGHNMRDGSMFGTLTDYDNKEYCEAHPAICFDTADGSFEYEVMSAFYDRVYYTDEDDFRFYDFIDASDGTDYDKAVRRLIEKSIYDTGVKAEYGDKLITLVTCAYHTENGRFVVIGRRKGNNT
jgi:sortase B